VSRTIRRTKGAPCYWLHAVNHAWLTEEEVKVNLRRNYTDCGYSYHSMPSKWFRNNEQRSFRTYAKTELSRFYKDNDYELQIRRRHMRDWWC
jgi:hypothetical protein